MKPSSRRKSCFMIILLAFALSGADCPPTGNNGNGNQNANENGNANANDNTSAPGLTVTLDGAHDTEFFMRAVVVVGERVVTRAEAAAGLPASEFSVNDFDNTESGDISLPIPVEAGQIVTIIAVETEGVDNITQFIEAPAPYDGEVEFVSFSGDADATPATGVATWTAGDEAAEIVVHFRRMPQIVLFAWGATNVNYDFDVPDVLALPERENINNRSFDGSGVIAAPDPTVFRTMQFKSGSQARFTALPNGEFLRWEDACGGSGLECTLTFGGESGIEDQSALLVTGYRECNIGTQPIYSGYGDPNNPGAGCTIVRP